MMMVSRSLTALLVPKVTLTRARLPLHQSLSECPRLLSSQPPPRKSDPTDKSDTYPDDGIKRPPNPQDFVNVRFEPGEWDRKKRDPLARPKWNNSGRLISAEDFAERPRVGFQEHFASMHDAHFTLSHQTHKEDQDIYKQYVDAMENAYRTNRNNVTSHEYIVQLIAYKNDLSKDRVAATIRLMHNEEQFKKEGRRMLPEVQEYMDERFTAYINEAYDTLEEPNPGKFVEPTIGADGMGTEETARLGHDLVSDLQDVDALDDGYQKRERDRAQRMIDSKIYKVDKDETLLNVKISKNGQSLLSKYRAFQKMDYHKRDKAFMPLARGQDGRPPRRRKRFKYVAKLIDTRADKKVRNKVGAKPWASATTRMEDTLVEENGELRAATVAEAKQTAWKPKHNGMEHMLKPVIQGWLDKVLRDDKGAWGFQEAPEPEKEEAEIEEGLDANAADDTVEDGEEADENEETADDPEGSEDSNSDSSDESGSDSSEDESSNEEGEEEDKKD